MSNRSPEIPASGSESVGQNPKVGSSCFAGESKGQEGRRGIG